MNARPFLVTVAVTIVAAAAACNTDGTSHTTRHEATAGQITACDRAVYGELLKAQPAGYLRWLAPCNHLTQRQWEDIVETDTQDVVNAGYTAPPTP